MPQKRMATALAATLTTAPLPAHQSATVLSTATTKTTTILALYLDVKSHIVMTLPLSALTNTALIPTPTQKSQTTHSSPYLDWGYQ